MKSHPYLLIIACFLFDTDPAHVWHTYGTRHNDLLSECVISADDQISSNGQHLSVKYTEPEVLSSEIMYLLFKPALLSLLILAFCSYYKTNSAKESVVPKQHEQLFSIVAHDLRSPLQTLKITLIKLRTALSGRDISQAELVSDDIENILNRTFSLLNNLLYWASTQTGQLHFSRDKLDMKRLIEQVLYDYEPVAAAKNITIENGVTDHLYCSGDMSTVKIILRNLVDNAIKFSAPSSEVVISGSRKNGECIVSVADSGKGIDSAIVKALAKKSMVRLSTGLSGTESAGIGLWLVKTMAEQNGGNLKIEQKRQGTKMSIHLPQYYRNHEQAENTYC